MDFYSEIKEQLINNEINRRVKEYSKNRSDLNTYYNVGKLLLEAGKHYGEGILKEYSKRLSIDFNKKYDSSTLNKMRKFYSLVEKMATLSPKLTYSHYVELLPFDNLNKIKYYINVTEKYNLSVRDLRDRIKDEEFERLSNNQKLEMIDIDCSKIDDFIKNPIIIKNNEYVDISERLLQRLILDDISSFMRELGDGFCFIDNEYKIKIGDRYNYIDLLFYNYLFNCFVVVELKTTELKKEHIGQISTYMNYINKNLKRIDQDKTIGIIICKKNNCFIMEYCSDERILSKEYKII